MDSGRRQAHASLILTLCRSEQRAASEIAYWLGEVWTKYMMTIIGIIVVSLSVLLVITATVAFLADFWRYMKIRSL